MDFDTEYNNDMLFKTGEDQGKAFCHALYNANDIGALEGQDGNVCCQYYNMQYGDAAAYTYGILSTATELVDLEAPVTIMLPDEDDPENGETLEYQVAIGAMIFDASVALTYPEDEVEEEEEDEDSGASAISLGWATLATSALMFAQ